MWHLFKERGYLFGSERSIFMLLFPHDFGSLISSMIRPLDRDEKKNFPRLFDPLFVFFCYRPRRLSWTRSPAASSYLYLSIKHHRSVPQPPSPSLFCRWGISKSITKIMTKQIPIDVCWYWYMVFDGGGGGGEGRSGSWINARYYHAPIKSRCTILPSKLKFYLFNRMNFVHRYRSWQSTERPTVRSAVSYSISASQHNTVATFPTRSIWSA